MAARARASPSSFLIVLSNGCCLATGRSASGLAARKGAP